ncbi:phenylalanyl-tRNA synthetase beta subunit [Breznakibacter xylanolyticus]|uniref:Phenylalanine--tRNA ligase beta subunit n=1 Tax=Breznakibacter xylanolyticus TaxID=990 RepID=A0A2W7NTK1_9BACT|nr:phenylalanine--tRNA ligase subunit beta [Breznakibacter xylanolyticus]PZX14562.1 phenylalanyl-tRNA synthetase beta subunit [Breznakibacter xylanolyticus]
MNISYNWLKNYIQTDITPEQVAAALTSIGLEVGSIEEIQTIKGGLEGIVIGEVITCQRHPNADKLSCTTVNIGQGEPLPIVCGAPNVAAGQKVLVATVGTTLYHGDESFVIKKSKLRGEPSEGMICAEDEIGLGTSHDGIMVLAPSAVPGTPAKTYFNIESDWQLEVDLTPNRIDSASHFGVARDLAAYLKQNGANVSTAKPSVEAFKTDNHDFPITVEVENQNACPRYSGVTISGITVKESPDWLKNRLRAIGMSPINNVVDVTNFVLHEIGQPLHAFDGNKITGNKIIVKTLPGNTKFVTLDGKERQLDSQDLMICNATDGMCLAGVFGGLDSGVTETTTRVFLESACFNPVYIRKTARRHILSTDSSFRFERGTDPNNTLYALKRAALLIKEVAGGTISCDIIDIYPTPITDTRIDVAFAQVKRLIGKEISRDTIVSILASLDIKVVNETAETLTVDVPPYRVDVLREVDVIEEILRIYGYNNVEMPNEVRSTLTYASKPDQHKVRNMIADQLIGAGFQEIMCNSLGKSSLYEGLTSFPDQQSVILANPLSNDLNALRQTLLFGGLESIQHNQNRKNANLKFFELGNCYAYTGNNKHEQKSYSEQLQLALFITGEEAPANWYTPSREVSFFSLKTHVLNILARVGVKAADINEETSDADIFSEALAIVDQNKQTLAVFGAIGPKFLKTFDIDSPVYYASLNWDLLMKKAARNTVRYSELSKYPEVRRDLALLINKEVSFAQIKQLAQKAEKKLLKKVSLFDVYEGEKLGAGKKSYAISFILQDDSQTLTDKQIDKIMQSLIQSFEKELGAQIRSAN